MEKLDYSVPEVRGIYLSDYEDNNSRIVRLASVVGYLYGLSVMQTAWLSKIKRLHDHKGVLEVHCSMELTSEEKIMIGKAWEDIGCEIFENVEYETIRSEYDHPVSVFRRIKSCC